MADLSDTLTGDATVPDQPTATEPPSTPDPRDEEIARLKQRTIDLEQQGYRMQEAILARPVASPVAPTSSPPGDPLQDLLADQSLTEEERRGYEAIDRKYGPVIQRRLQQQMAPLRQEAAQARMQSERMALHAKYGKHFAELENDALQAQQALAQQNITLPLEAVFMAVKGQQLLNQRETPQQVQARTQAREAGKFAAAASSAESTAAPTAGAGLPTLEQIKTMSADDAFKLIEQQGWNVYGSGQT